MFLWGFKKEVNSYLKKNIKSKQYYIFIYFFDVVFGPVIIDDKLFFFKFEQFYTNLISFITNI